MSGVPEFRDTASNSEQASQPASSVPSKEAQRQEKRRRYWDTRFAITTAILAFLGLLAAYLQYSVYPSIMVDQFSECNPSLHLSFLTYTWNAYKCLSSTYVAGLPSFDFAQLFLIILVLTQLYHFVKLKR